MQLKSSIVLIGLMLASIFAKSQCNVEISSESKNRFYLFIDGLKENEEPKSKLKIKNLSEGAHHFKIIFENKEFNNPQQKFTLVHGKSYILTIKLFTNVNRSWYSIIESSSTELTTKEIRKVKQDSLTQEELVKAETKTDSIIAAQKTPVIIDKPLDTNLVVNDSLVQKLPKSELNCTKPMHPTGFNLVVQQLQEQPDDNQKLEEAKRLIRENCLTAIQIMELLQEFKFEIAKLDLATYSYKYCFDPINYSFVEDVFEYESSKVELHKRIYATKK